MSALCTLRPLRPGDENLVRSSWHHTYRESKWRRLFASEQEFHSALRRIVDVLLVDAGVRVAAVSPEDDDLVLGWALAAPPSLHYVYVKSAYRKHGIGGQLLAEARKAGALTHATHETFRVRAEKHGLVYRPIMSLDDVRQKESA